MDELKKYRLLAQNDKGYYHLWLKMVELAEHTLNGLNVREIAKPYLTQLMHECNLLCHLGVLDNESAYYILKVESNSTISVRSLMRGKGSHYINPGSVNACWHGNPRPSKKH